MRTKLSPVVRIFSLHALKKCDYCKSVYICDLVSVTNARRTERLLLHLFGRTTFHNSHNTCNHLVSVRLQTFVSVPLG